MANVDHMSLFGTVFDFEARKNPLKDVVAPEFSDQSTYTAGQMVLKNGILYRFTAYHTGAWRGTDAEVVTVGGEVEESKSVVRNYEKYILENEELLSSASWVENYYISATGVFTPSNAAHYTELIPVENKVYLLVYVSNGVNNNTRIHGYDENGQWVKQIVVSASGTNTNPIMVDVPVSSDIKYIRLSINKVVTPVVFAIKKETTTADIDKLSKEVFYVLNTDSVIKYGIDFGTNDIYTEGYLYSTYNCIGKTIDTVSKSGNGNFKYYKIDVSGYIKVFFPCIKSSQMYGELFENSNGVICGFYTNSELDAKTIVGVDVPEGAQYLYLCDDNRWDDADLFFIGVISTIKSGGGSGTVIVHDDSYPSLTASEKSQIVSLCDNYYSIREVFRYGGTRYRNQYINSGCIVDGKFVINCGMFAQFIWMGRQASDFNLSNYSNMINKAFNWGYYFDFAIHKAIYGLAKNASATDASAKYYGYQAPGGSDPYAFNAYTQDNNMVWRYFMAAADLAEELYNMGCEVPRRAAEVGDLVFYRGPEYSGMTLETQLNFRNISHVGVITDIDYLGSGRMRTTEVTFRSDMGTVAHLSINENDNSDKTRAGFYENRIVMIARHPHAFGIASNVPEFITEI